MKVCVLSGSPKGKESITVQYIRFLEQAFPDHSFVIEEIGQKISVLESRQEEFLKITASVSSADIILFATPVYFLVVPAQLKRFIELVFSRNAADSFDGKYAAILTTSIHFFDHTAHAYLAAVSEDLGMQVIGSFSAKMDDLLSLQCQENLAGFGKILSETAAAKPVIQRRFAPLPSAETSYRPGPIPLPIDTKGKSVLILTDAAPGSNLEKMVQRAAACCGESASIVPLEDAMMKGGCLGCCRCAFDNTCVYQDGFSDFFKNTVCTADIIVFAGTIRDRYFSSVFKQFFDRSFFMGHVPMLGGRQIAVLAQGPFSRALPLPEILLSYIEMQEAGFAGFVSDEEPGAVDERIDSLMLTCIRLADAGFVPPRQFPAIAGRKIFRDEIWSSMRAVFRADDHYFRTHGRYDFPQKQYSQRIRTGILSLMLSVPKIRAEAQKTMNQRMVAPIRNAVEESPVLKHMNRKA